MAAPRHRHSPLPDFPSCLLVARQVARVARVPPSTISPHLYFCIWVKSEYFVEMCFSSHRTKREPMNMWATPTARVRGHHAGVCGTGHQQPISATLVFYPSQVKPRPRHHMTNAARPVTREASFRSVRWQQCYLRWMNTYEESLLIAFQLSSKYLFYIYRRARALSISQVTLRKSLVWGIGWR